MHGMTDIGKRKRNSPTPNPAVIQLKLRRYGMREMEGLVGYKDTLLHDTTGDIYFQYSREVGT